MTVSVKGNETTLSQKYILYPESYSGFGINLFETKQLAESVLCFPPYKQEDKLGALKNLASVDPLMDTVITEYMLKAVILKRVHDAGLMDRFVGRFNLETQNSQRRFNQPVARHKDEKHPENDMRGLTSHYSDTAFIMTTVLAKDGALASIANGIKEDMEKNRELMIQAVHSEISFITRKLEEKDPELGKQFQYNWHTTINPIVKGTEEVVFKQMYRSASIALTFRDDIVEKSINTKGILMCLREAFEKILTSPDRAMGKTLIPTLITGGTALGSVGVNPTDKFTGISIIKKIYEQPSMAPVIHQAHKSLMNVDALTEKVDSLVKSEAEALEQKRIDEKKAEKDSIIEKRKAYHRSAENYIRKRKIQKVAFIVGGLLVADQLLFDGAVLRKLVDTIKEAGSSVQVSQMAEVQESGFAQFDGRQQLDINTNLFDAIEDLSWLPSDGLIAQKPYDVSDLKAVVAEMSPDLNHDKERDDNALLSV